jgi:hypothetical protein
MREGGQQVAAFQTPILVIVIVLVLVLVLVIGRYPFALTAKHP